MTDLSKLPGAADANVETADAEAAAGHDELGARNRFARALNIEVLERGDGTAAFAWTAREQDLNAADAVHGGAIAGLADLILAMAAGSHPDPAERRFSITLSLNISFVAAARPGRLVCRGRRVGGGRNTVFCEGRIEQADGTLIATAQGAFKLLAARQGGG